MKRIVLIAIFCMPAAAAAQSVLSNCVNTITGASRYVNSAANCHTGEAFVQWNTQGATGPTGPTGPSGPTGPAGPAGMGLNYTIVVPSTGDQTANAAALTAALQSPLVTNATINQPVVIQLDSGTYAIGSLTLPPFVSIVGTGMYFTKIIANVTVPTPTLQSIQSISNLTIGGQISLNPGSIVFQMDRVRVEGQVIAPQGVFQSHIFVSNSLIFGQVNLQDSSPGAHVSFISTEADLGILATGVTLTCLADNNSSGQTLVQNASGCQ